MASEKFDTKNRHDIICPHCGYKFQDSDAYIDYDGNEIECLECGEEFHLEVFIEKTFTTWVKK